MKILLGIFIFCFYIEVHAQNLHIEIPVLANKSLTFWVHRGAKVDTIQKITLDAYGRASLSSLQTKYPEMLHTSIGKGEPFGLLYVPGEPVLIKCLEKECTVNTTFIENSPSNSKLSNWFDKLLVQKKRKFYMESLAALYPDGNSFKAELEAQETQINLEINQFNVALSQDTSFIAKYFKLKQISLELTADAVKKNDENKVKARNQFINDIDFDAMYRTDLWFNIINNRLIAYFENSPFYGKFGTDMIDNLNKTKSQEVFDALADDALFICNKASWNIDKEKIENYLISSGRISSSKLEQLKQLQNLHIGGKAPDLVVANPITKTTEVLPTQTLSKYFTLILFHESGCGHCEIEIAKIKNNYNYFTEHNIRIISFSSDNSETTYRETSKSFPWKDHYCSYNGINDVNFKNYIITGTPSIYLVDSNGVIVAKGATYEAVVLFLRGK